jgi:uncharacterized protein YndB with AHSA1/START domain
MFRKNRSARTQADHDIAIEREIDAPWGLVFDAWVDPRHLSQWWGPRGFTNPRCELDVREGGAIRIDMLAPDGTLYPMGGFYEEIVVPERLVFSSSPVDSLGHSLLDVLNTVTFSDRAGKTTTLTVQVHVLRAIEESAPYLQGMESGWRESLERLDSYLATISPKTRTSR